MSCFALSLFVLLSLSPLHAAIETRPAKGFHWYTHEEVTTKALQQQVPQGAPHSTSPYERLMALRKATLNQLAKALLEPSLESTRDYMKAQMAYAKKNQQFVRYWQQVLLMHPELDTSLNFPTDNSAIAIRNEVQKGVINQVLHDSATRYGLILFYRGASALSQKFILHLLPFVQEFGFSMISVTTDSQVIEGLPNPKSIPLAVIQQQIPLEAKYLPALYFVDLNNNKLSPVSYGFVALDELKARLFDGLTQFKRFSEEGVSE